MREKLKRAGARAAKIEVLSVRMSATVRMALEKAASADGRAVSPFVARLIERELRATGFLK